MKTVLLVNSSGARYFRRVGGVWQPVEQPGAKTRLWVIANLPEETLEAFHFPFLIGRDRSNFLERRLLGAFPHSKYRAAPVVSGGLLKSGTAVLTGLTVADAVTSQLDKLDVSISGVWGAAMLLTLMLKRLGIANTILAMPSVHHLRILVVKDGIPVLTRCVRRYSEDSDDENDSDANEILRTRQHLENQRIFEHDAIPPVLYLGESTPVHEYLTRAGLTLLPVPKTFAPNGEAGYLHALFEFAISSPRGQLAPLQLRARHLAENLRETSYLGIAASLLAIVLFGQADFRALMDLHQHQRTLLADMQLAASVRDHLADSISASGKDPALVRQAARFAALEMDAAPTPEAIFQVAASAIANLPQVRIKNLLYRFPKAGESYCQGQSIIDLPLLNGGSPADSGINQATGNPLRHAELQFAILLTADLTPAAQTEIRKRISATLKNMDGIQLMGDPAAFSLVNTLSGGLGLDTPQTENNWCMSISWKGNSATAKPASEAKEAKPDAKPSLIPAGEGANASPREFHVKGLP